ncbi:hypothetical protein [Brumimicrobium oceani]|uniref:hypothetical protein n=1 Tax=Brumimicrobium oceani TaxID=2100725 RepID=UPI0018EE9897|nr:hypothetical protein [Brumimicrobium oceani]
MQLFEKLEYFTTQIDTTIIDEEREKTLQPLIEFIQEKVDKNDEVKLNFICTHNSRRSHLAQIWAQTAAHYFSVPNVLCYSGICILLIIISGFSPSHLAFKNSILPLGFDQIQFVRLNVFFAFWEIS